MMFGITWEAWISHQFSMLAGRDGEGSAPGLSDSHDMVRQSPGGHYKCQGEDHDNDEYV